MLTERENDNILVKYVCNRFKTVLNDIDNETRVMYTLLCQQQPSNSAGSNDTDPALGQHQVDWAAHLRR